jgi:hypothetical protein
LFLGNTAKAAWPAGKSPNFCRKSFRNNALRCRRHPRCGDLRPPASALLPPEGMHARELIELAAIVSAHGPVLIESGRRIPAAGIEQYWMASKVRLDRWAWCLRTFADRASRDAQRRKAQWPAVCCALEEIFTGEVLTRVWSAVLCAHDRRHGVDELEPVARSVRLGHMEARHRALTLMVRGSEIDAEAAMKLNRIRRRAECWTDVLIGHLVATHDVSEFAIDPKRAREFAHDLSNCSSRKGGRHTWPVLVASLRTAFQSGLSPDSTNHDLNGRIATAVISCFPQELFDSTGLLHSLWMLRLTNIAEDTQGMIEELLAVEPHAAAKPAVSSDVPAERWRRFRG